MTNDKSVEISFSPKQLKTSYSVPEGPPSYKLYTFDLCHQSVFFFSVSNFEISFQTHFPNRMQSKGYDLAILNKIFTISGDGLGHCEFL